ncbi:guanine nucleotide-binding protein subunit beta [Pelomyxa schiedti]|nr:guanine nucleotide-binding protein subunit beta [Pelomyxa schiedti]
MLVVFGFTFGAAGPIDSSSLGVPLSPYVGDRAHTPPSLPPPPGTAVTTKASSNTYANVTAQTIDYFELAQGIFGACTTVESCELYLDSCSHSSGGTGVRAEVSLCMLGVALYELRVKPAVVCCLVCKRWKTLVYSIFKGPPGRGLCVLSNYSLCNDPLITPKRQPQSFLTRLHSIIPSFGSSPSTRPFNIRQPSYENLHLSAQGTFHTNYIYGMYAGNDDTVITNSKDARLGLWKWNSKKHKLSLVLGIPHLSSYILTSVLSPCLKYAVCGGFDDVVSLYDWKTGSGHPCQEFLGHEGYVSTVRFMNTTERLVSSSGDGTCILWDVETGTAITKFTGSTGDVMSVAVCPTNPNEFASGATDARTRIYDIRDQNPVITWRDAYSDIYSVCISGNGILFAAAGDEPICRVYDRRSTRAAAVFQSESTLRVITSVAFSASGHSLFACYDDGVLIAWSVLSSRMAWRDTSALGRLTAVSLNPSGDALFTASWDNLVRVYTSTP